MKKLSKIVLVLMFVIILSVTLASCSSSSSKIVGLWVKSEGYCDFSYLEFFSDGTYASSSSNYAGSYSIDGDRIKLSGILVPTKTYTFKISGNTLTLDGGVYEKK